MNTTTSNKKVSIKNKADFMAAITLPKDVEIEFRNIRKNDKEWEAGIVFRMVLRQRIVIAKRAVAPSTSRD